MDCKLFFFIVLLCASCNHEDSIWLVYNILSKWMNELEYWHNYTYSRNCNFFLNWKRVASKYVDTNYVLIWYLCLSLLSMATRDPLSHIASYWPSNELNVRKTINNKYIRSDNKGVFYSCNTDTTCILLYMFLCLVFLIGNIFSPTLIFSL